MPKILLTGGAGYIGSHTAAALLAAGYDVLVLDDFSNARPAAIEGVNALGHGTVDLAIGDCADRAVLEQVFSAHRISGVIHLAGLKAVGESMADPLRYYRVNLGAAAAVLDAMRAHDVHRFVFSSSATVYGDPDCVPITEAAPVRPVNPYGHSKWMIEQMLRDLSVAAPAFQAISLRYFNPAGAHSSGLIGEDPLQPAKNLFPILAEVAAGERAGLEVYGDDWETEDGSCIRDYIHVMDLAEGHVAALAYLSESGRDRASSGFLTLNLGTGRGYSVFETVQAFAKAIGRDIAHKVVARRPGDVARVVADPSLAEKLLDWRATRKLDRMCQDQWAWQNARRR